MAKMEDDSSSFSCQYLTPETAKNLRGTLKQIETEIGEILECFPFEKILSSLSSIVEPTVYSYLPDTVILPLEAISKRYDTLALGKYKKALIMRLIGKIDSKIARLNLPKSVLNLYPDTLNFVVEDLLSVSDLNYLTDMPALVRELRLTSTRSLPCGAAIADNSTYLTKRIYRNNGMRSNIKCLRFVYSRLGGLAPFYRTHVDTRYLKYFSERGWDACYQRIAELMRRNLNIRGMVSTSWFYDPQLETVCPWLAYLRRRPRENGAYFRCDGSGEAHIQRAIATSRTRRDLYEKGEYTPTCYTLIWARRDLLRWADTVEQQA